MYFHHDALDKMINMVKTYITDYLHEDIADYDVRRIVGILRYRMMRSAWQKGCPMVEIKVQS